MEYTVWTCGECGVEYPYPRLTPGKHGGPRTRGVDRRYGFLYSCWRNRKCRSHKRVRNGNPVILLAPGVANPPQPDNSELIARLKPKRKKKTQGGTTT